MYSNASTIVITVLLTLLIAAVLAFWLLRDFVAVWLRRELAAPITRTDADLRVPTGPERWGGPVGAALPAGDEPRASVADSFLASHQGEAGGDLRAAAGENPRVKDHATLLSGGLPDAQGGGGEGGRPPSSLPREPTGESRTGNPSGAVGALRAASGEHPAAPPLSLPVGTQGGARTEEYSRSTPGAPDRGPGAAQGGDTALRFSNEGGGGGGGGEGAGAQPLALHAGARSHEELGRLGVLSGDHFPADIGNVSARPDTGAPTNNASACPETGRALHSQSAADGNRCNPHPRGDGAPTTGAQHSAPNSGAHQDAPSTGAHRAAPSSGAHQDAPSTGAQRPPPGDTPGATAAPSRTRTHRRPAGPARAVRQPREVQTPGRKRKPPWPRVKPPWSAETKVWGNCYNCGKQGHRSAQCTEPRRSPTPGNGARVSFNGGGGGGGGSASREGRQSPQSSRGGNGGGPQGKL